MAGVRQLRVGFDLTFLGENAGGVGTYATCLLEALAVRDDITVHAVIGRDVPKGVREADWADKVRWSVLPVSGAKPRVQLLGQFTLLPAIAMRHRWDVVHCPANAGPIAIPGVATVITMHDVIWLHAGEEWGSSSAVRAMHRVSVPTVRRASRVIAISKAAASDLVRDLELRGDRIDVTPLGVAPPSIEATAEEELRLRLGLGNAPVILCVAQKRPYKNHDILIRGLAHIPDALLVLPGAPTEYEEYLRRLAVEEGVADRVRFVEWVSQPDLEGLYTLARCVALPSSLEGFGLPALEAMQRGIPVACSNIPTFSEVVGTAASRFDPHDRASVVAAIQGVLSDEGLRHRLQREGRARAARFTWQHTAEGTVQSYRRAVAASNQ